jgi:hypothetical protein
LSDSGEATAKTPAKLKKTRKAQKTTNFLVAKRWVDDDILLLCFFVFACFSRVIFLASLTNARVEKTHFYTLGFHFFLTFFFTEQQQQQQPSRFLWS